MIKVDFRYLKYIFILVYFISVINFSFAQKSNIDKIKINEYFNNLTLDSVYKVFFKNYGLRIVYDTTYCMAKRISYQFTNTNPETAIQITLDGGNENVSLNLKYSVDSNYIFHIVQKERIIYSDFDENNISEIKVPRYYGPPKTFHFTFSGILKDKYTGESLPFATILIKGTTSGTTTNSDGYFSLVNIPTDTNTLVISYMGYNSKEFQLTPIIPKRNMLIEIEPTSQILSEVTITSTKEELIKVSGNSISTIKMSPKKLSSLPNIGEKDIMRSFQLMPGVSSSNESTSGLYVRGSTPDQNLILYDGFTVYQVDHLYGFYSAFNSNAIKDIQLYKGGYEAKFGGRLASVTEITAKEGNQKHFNIGGDISLLSTNAYIEFPLGNKITFFVAGRKSYKGLLYNKIFKEFNKQGTETETNASDDSHMPQGASSTVTSYFYDLNSKITYKPTLKDILTVSFYNGTDKLDNSSSMSTPSFMQDKGIDLNSSTSDLTKYGNLGGAIKWSRKWNESLYGNTLLSYSNYYSNRDRSDDMAYRGPEDDDKNIKSGILENNNLKDYSLKSDYQFDVFKNNQFGFGTFATYNDIHYSYSRNDTSTFLNRQNYGLIAGGYIQDNIKLFKTKLVLIPGTRFTFFDITGKLYTEPRFSLNYNLTEKLKAKFATGIYYQFVNRVIREDIMSGSRDFWILSDGNKVPVGKAIHYIVGTDYDLNNYLFSIEAYYKDLKGLTEYSIRFKPNIGGSSDYSENFFNGTGTAKGIEFLIQKKAGKINGWICYTLGQALDYFPVYSSKSFPAAQDVTHEFKLVSMYKWKRFDFAITWIYATGRPYTAPEGGYQLTLLDETTNDNITVGAKNGLRLPDYHRLDFSVNFNILDSKAKDIGYIGLSVFNVYNRKNVWYKEYKIVEGNVIETNVNYLGFTPNITLSLKLR